jgi:hypothetical protein
MEIPNKLGPVVNQGILNLIDAGYKLIGPDGSDDTFQIRLSRPTVEAQYILWCKDNLRKVK